MRKLTDKIPKRTRRNLIESFVKHRYWYNQGNSSFSWLDDAFPFQKFVVLAGSVSGASFAFEHLRADLLLGVGVAAVVLGVRAGGKWLVGWFWHYNGGYDVETEWNSGKVPPQRVEIINVEELAEVVATKLTARLSGRYLR
jgi:hypothetical protein